MRISAKGRYALAAIIEIARKAKNEENLSVIQIATALGISKIYLEQVFTQLKKDKLLVAVKGAKGGYKLARDPSAITAWDVLASLEGPLVEKADTTVEDTAPEMEMVLHTMVFGPLDQAVRSCLSAITIQALLDDTARQQMEQSFMLNM